MKVIIAAAILIMFVGIVSARRALPLKPEIQTETEDVLSETSEPEASAQPITITPVPTPAPTLAPTVAPTPSSNPSSATGWIYPGASVISSNGKLTLNSSDDPDKVTEWYRAKINSGGYNIRNSVKTSANDNIRNVISAAGNDTSVEVEITKKPSDSISRIEVEVSSL